MNFIKDLKAFVFDLDGTVVDSKLNFDEMRKDLGYPKGAPILEHLETLSDPTEIKQSHEIIHKHELIGAQNSTIIDGYLELHNYLKKEGYKLGLLTRNSTPVTNLTLNKFDLEFDCVLTRDDCAPKPRPDGLLKMQELWNIKSEEMIYIGDFLFDLETAKNAGSFSGLYLWPENEDFKHKADLVIKTYEQFLITVDKK
jgi:HAD superfamily hydrolase (TIGR01549 family)